MTPLIRGFASELEKIAFVGNALKGLGRLVLKHPGKSLAALMIGSAGFEGMKAAEKPERMIQATAAGPSPAWATNYSEALGIPRRMSALEERMQSLRFPRWRAQ